MGRYPTSSIRNLRNMKTPQEQDECPHNQTVELFGGIFKCSVCGALWDEADEAQKIARQEGADESRRLQEARQRRNDYYRRRYRRP